MNDTPLVAILQIIFLTLSIIRAWWELHDYHRDRVRDYHHDRDGED